MNFRYQFFRHSSSSGNKKQQKNFEKILAGAHHFMIPECQQEQNIHLAGCLNILSTEIQWFNSFIRVSIESLLVEQYLSKEK